MSHDYGAKGPIPRPKPKDERRKVLTRQCKECKVFHPVTLFPESHTTCTFCQQAEAAAIVAAENEAAKAAAEADRKQKRAESQKRARDSRRQELKAAREQQQRAVEEEERKRKEFNAQEEAKLEAARRELARRHLLPFVERFNDQYEAGWVHKDICQRLERFSDAVAAKQSPRLMLFMPPRHGKSELASKTFPAWHLGRYPFHEFIGCSYSGSLAMDFSRKVRELLRDAAYKPLFPKACLDRDSQSAERWNTDTGGGYVAAGVGGPITGRGAHILVIDDPVKNREDAESESTRNSIWDWYTSTAYTRLAPGGGVLIILTRWHDDDLAGRLLEKMRKEEGDTWEVIEYPAIATVDETYRKKGEALHPQRYDTTALERIKRAVGERDWWALYQQQPTAEDGDLFTKSMIHFYNQKDLPAFSKMRFYTAWDLAIGQAEHNDYSVGITVGVDQNHRLWIVDIQRGRWNAKELTDKIIDVWTVWRSDVTGIERGHIEMTLGPFLDKRIKERKAFGLYYEPLKTGRRDKVARARSIQGRMQQGMVMFREGCEDTRVLIRELLRFPNGVNDDQVDALAWLGLMLDSMVAVKTPVVEKRRGWREKLLRGSIKRGRKGSSMCS